MQPISPSHGSHHGNIWGFDQPFRAARDPQLHVRGKGSVYNPTENIPGDDEVYARFMHNIFPMTVSFRINWKIEWTRSFQKIVWIDCVINHWNQSKKQFEFQNLYQRAYVICLGSTVKRTNCWSFQNSALSCGKCHTTEISPGSSWLPPYRSNLSMSLRFIWPTEKARDRSVGQTSWKVKLFSKLFCLIHDESFGKPLESYSPCIVQFSSRSRF